MKSGHKIMVTLTGLGGDLSHETFFSIEEAREFIRKEWLPILDAGDVIKIVELD